MTAQIKNLKKVANRILEAVKNKEKVILYGDADPDGVASVIILKETLDALGSPPIQIYFPDREKEGYGITEVALKILAKKAPALLITLDCGIGNVREVEIAKKIGFEVIIIDHHKMLPEVPKASIICDPKQKGDKYPFKELATAGISYKLSKILFSSVGKSYRLEKFLELVAIATLADQMPLLQDNEKLVKEGILALNFTERKGLKSLMEETQFGSSSIKEVRRKILPPLNAALATGSLNEAYLLLIEKDPKKAKEGAKKLIEKAELRREEIKSIFWELEERILKRGKAPQRIIFEGDESWPLIFLGSVASRICQKYKKPVFLFKKGKEESPGAVRTPKGLDGVKMMINCRQLLITYGGHPLAAGFRIKNENLQSFKECLFKYFKR